MKVDIWSDIRCPFCYIGKRKFETALSQFEHKDQVEVNWHSFELEPSLQTDTSLNIYDYLSERKGISRSRSVQMHEQVMQTAKEAGLQFNFDNMVIANSFNAHRLIQLAKTKGLDDAAEENLFKANFTEGQNIDDHETLTRVGIHTGLGKQDIAEMLSSEAYTEQVRTDEAIAAQIGINGVPFFVLNNKYGISGAQAPETFLQALQQTWTENEATIQAAANDTGSDACSTGDTCTT